jgi:hypothetical protein
MSCLKPMAPLYITNLINRMPIQYGQIMNSGLFQFRGAFTEVVGVDVTNSQSGLIPTSPWCCDNAVTQSPENREIRTVVIPRTKLEDAIWACDISGARADGLTGYDQGLQSVAQERSKKLLRMRYNFDTTFEYRMLGALRGQVLEADGTKVLLDIYKMFGVTQETVDVHVASDSTTIIEELRKAITASRIGARSFTPVGYRMYVGTGLFNALIANKDIKDIWKRCCDVSASILQGAFAQPGGSFTLFPGLEIVEYVGTQACFTPSGEPVGYIGDMEGFLIPIPPRGFEMYEILGAPPKTINLVNTMARNQIYMWEKPICERDENDPDGIKMMGESNTLPIVKHPQAIIRINAV